MLKAQIVQDGDHQTIVLPPSIRLEGDEVLVEHVPNGNLLVSPSTGRKKPDWESVFQAFDEADIPADFLTNRDFEPPVERSDW